MNPTTSLTYPPFNMKDWGGEHLRDHKRRKFGVALPESIPQRLKKGLTWKTAN